VREDGLIAVPVAEGPVEVGVDWTTTPDAIAGRTVTLLALIGAGLMEWKLRRTRQS